MQRIVDNKITINPSKFIKPFETKITNIMTNINVVIE